MCVYARPPGAFPTVSWALQSARARLLNAQIFHRVSISCCVRREMNFFHFGQFLEISKVSAFRFEFENARRRVRARSICELCPIGRLERMGELCNYVDVCD